MPLLLTGVCAALIAGGLGYVIGNDDAAAQRDINTQVAMPTDDRPEPPTTTRRVPQAVLAKPITVEREDVRTLADTLALPTDFLQTAALYGLLERADVADLKRHALDAKALRDSSDRRAALSIIYLRFSELDPDGAVDHLYAIGAPDRDYVLYTLFFSWAKRNLDAAVARARAITSTADRATIANAFMRAYADRDLDFVTTLAERVAPNPNAAGRYAAQVIAERAARDPVAAMQLAMSLESPDLRRSAMYQVAQVWARNDPWAAYRYAQTVDDEDVARQLRSTSLQQMAERDPEQTLELLDDDMTRRERSTIVSAAMRQLAGLDPQRALSVARNLDDFELRNEALSTVFQSWAQRDPRAAARALESIDNPTVRSGAGWSVASALARSDPREALAWAMRLEGRPGDIFRSVVSEIAQRDPELALTSLASLPPSSNRAQLQSMVLGYLAQSDPAIAITYAEDMPPGQSRDQALASIANTWANHDPAAAMEWVLTRSPAEQHRLLSSVAYNLANENPELALAYIDRLDGALRSEWIGQIISSLSYQNPQIALDWAARHRDDPNHDQWMQAIISGLAAGDVRRAAALLDTISDPQIAHNATVQLAHQWANQDPAAAARWVASLPAGDADAGLVQAVVTSWQSYDPAAAAAWVDALPAGARRDAGLAALLSGGHLATADARSLLRRIDDPTLRQDAAQQHVFHLMNSDPDAARAFVDESDFPPETRTWLLEMIAEQNPTG